MFARRLDSSRAFKEMTKQTKELKSKAVSRVREWLLTNINLLKKPQTNLQQIQDVVLLKNRAFYEFLAEVDPDISAEVVDSYSSTMDKLYGSPSFAYFSRAFLCGFRATFVCGFRVFFVRLSCVHFRASLLIFARVLYWTAHLVKTYADDVMKLSADAADAGKGEVMAQEPELPGSKKKKKKKTAVSGVRLLVAAACCLACLFVEAATCWVLLFFAALLLAALSALVWFFC